MRIESSDVVGEEPAGAEDPDRPRHWPGRVWIDALIAVCFVGLAAIPRYALPGDGFFFDDAWQATAAVKGGPGDLATLGQTQPGYALLQMASARLFGSGDLVLVAPALIAGALGPAALYLVLRSLATPRAVAGVLSAALLASHTHAAFSGRVKTYTTDILIVLLLVVLVDRLGAKRWSARIAVAWAMASVTLAVFSSFGLILTACAGVVLVLDARGDRTVRMASVAVQGVCSLIVFGVAQSSHNAAGVSGWFTSRGGMIGHDDGAQLPVRILKHLHRVTESYTGGSRLLIAVLTVAALLGLLRLATTGSHRTVGRFLALVLSAAVVGSVIGRLPLGGEGYHMARAHMWLFPVLAIGIATAAAALTRPLPRQVRPVLGVAVCAVAVVVLANGVQREIIYPPEGAREATRAVFDEGLRTDDVVLVSRLQTFAFALAVPDDVPYRLKPHPDRLVGFAPEFEDPRIVPLDLETTDAELAASVTGAGRVRLISMIDVENTEALEYALKLADVGFEAVSSERIGGSLVTTFTR